MVLLLRCIPTFREGVFNGKGSLSIGSFDVTTA